MNLAVFDIDGTLTLPYPSEDGSFLEALASVFGFNDVDPNWTRYAHVTDSGLVQEVCLLNWGREPGKDEVHRFREAYCGAFLRRSGPDEGAEVPGASAFVDLLLERQDWRVALATGNFHALALHKLERGRIRYDNVPVATADDDPSRAALVKLAVARAQAEYGIDTFEHVVSIGDAPWDLRTARELQMPFVVVGERCGGPVRAKIRAMLDERLGGGTFGEVWRAHHHVWVDQLVAVKIPTDPQYVRNLRREGVAVHGLVHPNIVRAMGFDPDADPPYLVMEYVPGTSLRPLIQTRRVQVDEAVTILRQVLLGLDFAHRRGVIHRDVKPENILIHERSASLGYGGDGIVKITDFGLGRAANTTAVDSIAYSASLNNDAAREIAGTLDYMPPELRGGAEPDARADLYACGVVLYEMLTGERPAGTEVPSDLNAMVPKRLDEVFRRSYARLEKRYTSAREFLEGLSSAGPPPLPGLAAARGRGAVDEAPPPPGQRRCSQCRQIVGMTDQFCMFCGTQIAPVIRRCEKCGAYPDPLDRFCIYCGEELTAPLVRV
jgi:phosphoglycolate phosphatase-like HAD superfamily hydrolase